MIAYVLNLIDLSFTLYVLNYGAIELNPLIRNVPFMIFYKVVIVGVLLWWLSRHPEKLARIGLRLCTVVYAGLALYHLYFIGGILL